MIVRISAEDERDLEDIDDYIAKDNPVRAMTFVQELRAAALSLGDLNRTGFVGGLLGRVTLHPLRLLSYKHDIRLNRG